MKRYLVFDSGCAVCNGLATAVQEATQGQLTVISIHGHQAQTLLNQAFPKGWVPAPYLIVEAHGKVQAWTGLRSAVRLGWLMGPREAWHVWQLARQAGVVLPPGAKAASKQGISRRTVLKTGAGVGAAIATATLLPSEAFACIPCDTCGSRCYYVDCPITGVCRDGLGHFISYYSCNKYDCYDPTTGEFCRTTYTGCGCWECL